MIESHIGDIGIVILGFFIAIVTVCWILLPIAVFGVKSLLRDVLNELRTTRVVIEEHNRTIRELFRMGT